MATSLETLEAIAPHLVADETRASTFLTMAANRLSSDAFGDFYVEACAWLAAHLMTVAALDDGAEASSLGGVSERKAGDLSIKFAASSSSSSIPEGDQSLVSTRYGREFIALRNSCPDSVANVIAVGGEYAS